MAVEYSFGSLDCIFCTLLSQQLPWSGRENSPNRYCNGETPMSSTWSGKLTSCAEQQTVQTVESECPCAPVRLYTIYPIIVQPATLPHQPQPNNVAQHTKLRRDEYCIVTSWCVLFGIITMNLLLLGTCVVPKTLLLCQHMHLVSWYSIYVFLARAKLYVYCLICNYPVNLQLTTRSMSNLFPLTCQPPLSLFRSFFSSGSCLTFSVLLPSSHQPLLPLLRSFFSSGYSLPSQPLLPLLGSFFSSGYSSPCQPLLPLLGSFSSSGYSSPSQPLLPLLGSFSSSGYSSPSQPLLPLLSSSCPFPSQPLLGRFLSSTFSLLFPTSS